MRPVPGMQCAAERMPQMNAVVQRRRGIGCTVSRTVVARFVDGISSRSCSCIVSRANAHACDRACAPVREFSRVPTDATPQFSLWWKETFACSLRASPGTALQWSHSQRSSRCPRVCSVKAPQSTVTCSAKAACRSPAFRSRSSAWGSARSAALMAPIRSSFPRRASVDRPSRSARDASATFRKRRKSR